MSRCRYLDMFLTIWLKKDTRVLSELSSTQRCHPKESQNTKILPPVLIVSSNSPGEWEGIRETSAMLALRCHSLFDLLFLPFKTKKTRKKRRNQQGKHNKNGTSKAMYHYSVLTIGSMGLVNICLTIYPYKIKPFMDRKIYFTNPSIFCKIYGLHSCTNTCGKTPPCKPLPNWLNKKGFLSTKKT